MDFFICALLNLSLSHQLNQWQRKDNGSQKECFVLPSPSFQEPESFCRQMLRCEIVFTELLMTASTQSLSQIIVYYGSNSFLQFFALLYHKSHLSPLQSCHEYCISPISHLGFNQIKSPRHDSDLVSSERSNVIGNQGIVIRKNKDTVPCTQWAFNKYLFN